MKNRTPGFVNHRRNTKQFNAIETNSASAPKDMRGEYFNDQIKNTFDMDVDPYKKYQEIKNNPNIEASDLSEIWLRMLKDTTERDEIIAHQDKLKTKEGYKKYQEIKDNPNLKAIDLLRILVDMQKGTPERNEIKSRHEKLETEERYKKYQEIKDNPNLKAIDLLRILVDMQKGTPERNEIKSRHEKLEN